MNNPISIKIADITQEKVCAIVNAANSTLMGGGGVDGAIHKAGGSVILEACKKIRNRQYPEGLPTGEAVQTTAGKMPASYVIHTVGPVYAQCGSHCETLLASCYTQSLQLVAEIGCTSVAFPAISTGIYGYPKIEAARIAYNAVKVFLKKHSEIEVRFIFHNKNDAMLFQGAIE